MSAHKFENLLVADVKSHLGKNLWRVAATMTFDDCMQEAFLIFDKCSTRYPDVEPNHFRSLFKTAWQRRFTDMAYADSHYRQHTTSDQGDDGTCLDVVGCTDTDACVNIMLKQAPAEIKSVLAVLFNAPTEILELAMQTWRDNRRWHAGGNRQVAEWLGWPADSKPLDMVNDYFQKP